ncbi:hypothetical protein [Saccharothrix deserti]|uniref:hypothetical protein n=1 Tax=Saccharothrix deserti TaxID=2593674 RepID=UPI00131E9FB2|nr:hypothetical protein [Saccharothrix deserti]
MAGLLVPDQCAVEEFVAAGLEPALHDRVHPRDPDTAEDDLDARVGEDGVEQGGYFPSRSRIRNRGPALVFEVHDQVLRGLNHPQSGRICGGTQDPDPAAAVFDDREHVQAGAAQGGGLEEVAGQ